MKAVIFLGPSLPVEEAREVLDAIYLPPASQADLLSALHLYRPQVIGLIDGVFGQSLSVWHKEILYALEQGVWVYGASSMGALRAVETAEFGMIGVGQIYAMFADGRLQDDDEVALLHGPVDYGYRPLTLPMVNVRATLQKALQSGLIDEAVCVGLTEVAKSIYYGQRTRSTLSKAWSSWEAGPAMGEFLKTDYVDLKRQDALELLSTLARLPDSLPPARAAFRVQDSPLFETMRSLDRRVKEGSTEVSLETVARTSALYHPHFAEVRFQALNRRLVVLMARYFGVTVTAQEVDQEEQRFRRRQQLEDQRDYQQWLLDNRLEAADMRLLMEEFALCRVLQKWLGARSFLEKSTRAYLDELRLRGEFPEAVRQAAQLEQTEFPRQACPGFEELFVEHLSNNGGQMDTSLSEWMQEAGFRSQDELHHYLWRARAGQPGPGTVGAASDWD